MVMEGGSECQRGRMEVPPMTFHNKSPRHLANRKAQYLVVQLNGSLGGRVFFLLLAQIRHLSARFHPSCLATAPVRRSEHIIGRQ